MKLASIEIQPSPDLTDYVRITAHFNFEDGEKLEIWYELPQHLQSDITTSGNPWLIFMLVHAIQKGEDINLDKPVDPALMENLKGLVMQWCAWYPQFKKVNITAPLAKYEKNPERGKTAAFYSGGIDSWFTVLRHCPEREAAAIGNVDDLLFVHGFDIPETDLDELGKMQAMLAPAANELGREFIVMRTNLRKHGSLWTKAWGPLTHAAALAATAMLVERRYDTVLIGSAIPYGQLFPWGSHPLTDVLFSTSGLRIMHDGAMYTRVEKTELVGRHEVALRNLHVCYAESSADNCGTCPKCLRTMLTLELFGTLPNNGLFREPLDLGRAKQLYLADEASITFFKEINDAARIKRAKDIAKTTEYALNRSRRLRKFIPALERARRLPGLWRIGTWLRSKLLAS